MIMCGTEERPPSVTIARGIELHVIRFPTASGQHVEVFIEGRPRERAVFEARSDAEVETILGAFAASVRLRQG